MILMQLHIYIGNLVIEITHKTHIFDLHVQKTRGFSGNHAFSGNQDITLLEFLKKPWLNENLVTLKLTVWLDTMGM